MNPGMDPDMNEVPPGLLLDTCAVLWVAGSAPMHRKALAAIAVGQAQASLFVSPISAWELGLLCRQRGAKPAKFVPNGGLAAWFASLMAKPGLRHAAFTAEIGIAASFLPPGLHADPGDRLLVATARHLSLAIITRDRKILDYAALGHVAAIPC